MGRRKICVDTDRLADLYNNGEQFVVMEKEFGVTRPTIMRILGDNGVPKRKRRRDTKFYERQVRFEKYAEDGTRQKVIALKEGISFQAVQQILKRRDLIDTWRQNSIKRRVFCVHCGLKIKTPHKFNHTKVACVRCNPFTINSSEIIVQYLSGTSSTKISRRLGIGISTILNGLKTNNISIKPAARTGLRGKAHPAYKNGTGIYGGQHFRRSQKYGRADCCKRCGSMEPSKRYHTANLTGNYWDVDDFLSLCPLCHKRYDIMRNKNQHAAEEWLVAL